MDFKETLFRRTLVKRHIDERDEEKNLMAETLTVTKEQNGYALWYQGGEIVRPRIIAWSHYNRDDLIAYAAKIDALMARKFAGEGIANYDHIQNLDDLALDPIVEKL